jgi:hypothetical protein
MMWKLETEDLGREDGFDLEAILTDDEEGFAANGYPTYGVVVEASRNGIVFGLASIWDIDGSLEDGDDLHRTLGIYGSDLIYDALEDARATLEGLKNSLTD